MAVNFLFLFSLFNQFFFIYKNVCCRIVGIEHVIFQSMNVLLYAIRAFGCPDTVQRVISPAFPVFSYLIHPVSALGAFLMCGVRIVYPSVVFDVAYTSFKSCHFFDIL